MILYHGSDVEVKNPKILKSEKGRDFGCAFYLTPIKEQAERMAKRKQRMNKSDSAIVSVFEFNEKETNNLKYKSFKNPDLEWLNMIIQAAWTSGRPLVPLREMVTLREVVDWITIQPLSEYDGSRLLRSLLRT